MCDSWFVNGILKLSTDNFFTKNYFLWLGNIKDFSLLVNVFRRHTVCQLFCFYFYYIFTLFDIVAYGRCKYFIFPDMHTWLNSNLIIIIPCFIYKLISNCFKTAVRSNWNVSFTWSFIQMEKIKPNIARGALHLFHQMISLTSNDSFLLDADKFESNWMQSYRFRTASYNDKFCFILNVD